MIKHLLTIAFVAIMGSALADMNVAQNLPRKTGMAVRLDLNEVLQTPLGTRLLMSNSARINTIKTFVHEHVGIDFDLVDRGWLLSWGDDEGVVILKGNFSATEIRTRFTRSSTATEIEHDGCLFAAEYLDEDSGEYQLGVVVDNSTIFFGKQKSAEYYLRVLNGKEKKIPAADERVAVLSESKDHIIAVMGDPANLKDFDNDFARYIKKLWIAGNVETNVKLEGVLEATDNEKAEAFAMILKGFIELKKESSAVTGNPLLKMVMESAEIKSEGNRVYAKASLRGKSIENLVALTIGQE